MYLYGTEVPCGIGNKSQHQKLVVRTRQRADDMHDPPAHVACNAHVNLAIGKLAGFKMTQLVAACACQLPREILVSGHGKNQSIVADHFGFVSQNFAAPRAMLQSAREALAPEA